MEDWINLEDIGFPDYAVSRFGEIRNENRGTILRQSHNQAGLYKVGMILATSGSQVTVAVAPLVARAFLPRQDNSKFDTPINVDGDRSNNRVDNLMMRPRWFAVKYHQQFHNDARGFIVPIVEMHTGEEFATSWEAAIKYGLLDREIAIATLNRTYVFPTGQEFRELD